MKNSVMVISELAYIESESISSIESVINVEILTFQQFCDRIILETVPYHF